MNRVQMTRKERWREQHPHAVIVDRNTRWGNPFRVHRSTVYGPAWEAVRANWGRLVKLSEYSIYISTNDSKLAAVEAVKCFASLLEVRKRDEPDQLTEWLAPLAGKDLACWCPLSSVCHASLLMAFARWERP